MTPASKKSYVFIIMKSSDQVYVNIELFPG